MAAATDDLYIEILRKVVPDQYGLFPPVVINALIARVTTQDGGTFTPVPPDANNISHVDALQLIHDILVFAGTVISVYRPGLPSKPTDPNRSTPLTDEMKKQIETIVIKDLEAQKQQMRDPKNDAPPQGDEEFLRRYTSVYRGLARWRLFFSSATQGRYLPIYLSLAIIWCIALGPSTKTLSFLPSVLITYAASFFFLTAKHDVRLWHDITSHLFNAPNTKVALSSVRTLVPPLLYEKLRSSTKTSLRNEPVYIIHPKDSVSFDLPCGFTAYPFFLLPSVIISYVNAAAIDDTLLMEVYHEIGHTSYLQLRILAIPPHVFSLCIAFAFGSLFLGESFWIAFVFVVVGALTAKYLATLARKLDLMEITADTFALACHFSWVLARNPKTDEEAREMQLTPLNRFMNQLRSQADGERRSRIFYETLEMNKKAGDLVTPQLLDQWLNSGLSRDDMLLSACNMRAATFLRPLRTAQYIVIGAIGLISCLTVGFNTAHAGWLPVVLSILLSSIMFLLIPIGLELISDRPDFFEDSLLLGDAVLQMRVRVHNAEPGKWLGTDIRNILDAMRVPAPKQSISRRLKTFIVVTIADSYDLYHRILLIAERYFIRPRR